MNEKDYLDLKKESMLMNISFSQILRNKDISEKSIERHTDEFSTFHWHLIAEFQNLSKKFLIKHINNISLEHLLRNKKIKTSVINEISILKKML